MAVFGIITEPNNKEKIFIEATKKRSEDSNYLRNPFFTNISSFVIKNDSGKGFLNLHVFRMKPIYFNFSLLCWPFLPIIYVITGFSYWLIPVLFICSFGIFWSSHFFYLMAKKGLRKNGYTGSIKRVNKTEIISKVVLDVSE